MALGAGSDRRIRSPSLTSGDKLLGIISRANVIRGLAAQQTPTESIADDRTIKASVEKALSEAGVRRAFLDVIVSGGVVTLWEMVETLEEKAGSSRGCRNGTRRRKSARQSQYHAPHRSTDYVG